jgi:hypothetical protein
MYYNLAFGVRYLDIFVQFSILVLEFHNYSLTTDANLRMVLVCCSSYLLALGT